MDQKWSPRTIDCRHAPSAVGTRRSVGDDGEEKHQANKSELVTGKLAGTIGAHFDEHCDGEGLDEYQLNKSELVVGIDTQLGSSQQYFTSTFIPPTTQPLYTAVTLQLYSRNTDILCFPEPAVDQSSHYQQYHTDHEDRGMILPHSFDAPSSIQPRVNDSGVLDINKRVRLTTRGEVLECFPSNDMYKYQYAIDAPDPLLSTRAT